MNFPVLERHRRAAMEVMFPSGTAYLNKTGELMRDRIAQAIANAEGEERVRAVVMALESQGRMEIAGKVAGADIYSRPIADLEEDDEMPDEDIRALVLAGWVEG